MKYRSHKAKLILCLEVLTSCVVEVVLLLCYTWQYSLLQHIITFKNTYDGVSTKHTEFSLIGWVLVNRQMWQKNIFSTESPVHTRILEKDLDLLNVLNRELEGNIKSLLIKLVDDTVFILPLAGRGINMKNIQAAIQRYLGCLVNQSLPLI